MAHLYQSTIKTSIERVWEEATAAFHDANLTMLHVLISTEHVMVHADPR